MRESDSGSNLIDPHRPRGHLPPGADLAFSFYAMLCGLSFSCVLLGSEKDFFAGGYGGDGGH